MDNPNAKMLNEIKEGLNTVETALIEIVAGSKNVHQQLWYHYDSADINPVDANTIFIRFYNGMKNTASYGIDDISSIISYNKLHMPELMRPHLIDHYHIVINLT